MVRQAAMEQFCLTVTRCVPGQKLLVFFITLLFTVLSVCKHGTSLGYSHNKLHFTAIVLVNLRPPAPPVKNWRILLVQSVTAHMLLLTATSTFGLGRRRLSSPQHCYLHCLHTFNCLLVNCFWTESAVFWYWIILANEKQCFISLATVHRPNWSGVCSGFVCLTMLLLING